MNLKMQERTIERVFQKAYDRYLKENPNDRGVDIDEVLDDVLDRIDPQCHLDENLHYLQDEYSWLFPEELDNDYQWEEYQSEIQSSYLETISMPFYHCHDCDGKFQTTRKDEMLAHYANEHDLKMIHFEPRNPYDMNYIILNKLVNTFSESKNKKYIKISNMELHKDLVCSLGFELNDKDAPKSSRPYFIMNQLGLLTRQPRQRERLGRDSKGCRIFYINIQDLREVVNDSDFDDLKVKLGILDEDELLPKITIEKTSSSTSQEKSDDETGNGDTGGLHDEEEKPFEIKPEDAFEDPFMI